MTMMSHFYFVFPGTVESSQIKLQIQGEFKVGFPAGLICETYSKRPLEGCNFKRYEKRIRITNPFNVQPKPSKEVPGYKVYYEDIHRTRCILHIANATTDDIFQWRCELKLACGDKWSHALIDVRGKLIRYKADKSPRGRLPDGNLYYKI